MTVEQLLRHAEALEASARRFTAAAARVRALAEAHDAPEETP